MIPLYWFTGLSAFFLASVAAFFSITGLGALYAAAFIPIVIMGSSIELGKIVATFWVHRNAKIAPKRIVIPMLIIILGSMVVTSGGVYGFLIKGHIEQEVPLADRELQISRFENQIRSETALIERSSARIEQLDGIINTLVDYDKISGPDGARAVRSIQEPERQELNILIDSAYLRIDTINDKLLTLKQEVTGTEAKLGPVKYLADLLSLPTKDSVKYFTLLIVILLDPFAIILVVATSISHRNHYLGRKEAKEAEVKEVSKEVFVEKEVIDGLVERAVEKSVEETPEKMASNFTESGGQQDELGLATSLPVFPDTEESMTERNAESQMDPLPLAKDLSGWYDEKHRLTDPKT